MTEDQIEQLSIARLRDLGYAYQHSPGIAHDGEHPVRESGAQEEADWSEQVREEALPCGSGNVKAFKQQLDVA